MSYSPTTQPLPEEPSSMVDQICQDVKFGYLVANDCWHEIPVGETKIGRDALACSIVLDDETVSKEHAVFESEGAEDTFIYDAGSTNKTKIGKMTLKPHCRYKVNDQDVIKLGNIFVKYRVMDHKIKSYISTILQQLPSLGKHTLPAEKGKKNLPIASDTPIIINRVNTTDETDVFKSPPIVLKEKMKQVKKYYYVPACESLPAIDIFSQTTQCELTNSKQDCSLTNSISELQFTNDDDIYNLSTQCEYAGDMLKPKCESGSESPLLNECSAVKAKEVLHCDVNESGIFDFLKKKETKNVKTPYMHQSLKDDVFELETQCQTKFNASCSRNLLNFKSIINKPGNYMENLNMELNKNSNHNKANVSLGNDDLEKKEANLTTLDDGEDEELCRLMRINSTVTNKDNHNPIICRSNILEIEQNKFSDEIFMVATQVSEIEHESDVNECKKSNFNNIYNERVGLDKSGKLVEGGNNYQSEKPEQEGLVSTVLELKKQEQALCQNISSEGPRLDEDLILTQVFRVPHHISENNSKNYPSSSIAEARIIKGKNEDIVKNVKSFEMSEDSEDLKLTQIFNLQDSSNFREKESSDVKPPSQDDIDTQIFPSNLGEQKYSNSKSKSNDDQRALPITMTAISRNPEYGIVLSDSGDETESDLEIKLCLESSLRKQEKELLSVKPDPESPSSRRTVDSKSPVKSASPGSDKTVSDLDIVEIQESRAALLTTNNCEDLISTQIFPSKRNISKEFCAEAILNTEENCNMETIFNKIEEKPLKGKNCEDFIPTQMFPVEKERKSPTVKSGKGESYINHNTRPTSNCGTIQVSSEEDDFSIEENSNESESLIKEIEDFGPSSQLVITTKRCTLTSPQHGQPEPESSLTLSPSHPAYEAFSEIDELIGNNRKEIDNSESGIGAKNFFEKHLETENGVSGLKKIIGSDSDETDCEKEPEAVNKLGRQETFVISRPGPLISNSPLTRGHIDNIQQSVSNPTSCGEIDGSDKTFETSERRKTFLTKGTESEDFVKLNRVSNSPRKRALLINSNEGVLKKRVKNAETRKEKSVENTRLDNFVLTQSLKLRNRVIRQRKTSPDCGSLKQKTASDTHTCGKGKPSTEQNSRTTLKTAPRVRHAKERTSANRKLMGEFQNTHEEGKKGNGTPKNGDGSKKTAATVTKIAFTGFESNCHDKIIKNLGGEKVNHLDDVHVLVTDRVRRTVKFLSAVALGLPIVSPKWLVASAKEMKFLNPWDFLLEDKSSEERWEFNLKTSLEKWKKQKLLNGYTVFATENSRPPLDELLSIVRCCGGMPVTSHPQIWPEKSIVLTCMEDKKCWPPYKWRHVKIVHYEFLLSGVLKYFMDFKTYKLR